MLKRYNEDVGNPNIAVTLDKIPEGKKFLDVLDKVAEGDLNEIQDEAYNKICDILEKKNLNLNKDLDKIIDLTGRLSKKLTTTAINLKDVLA